MKKLFTAFALLGLSSISAVIAANLSVTYSKTDASCNGSKNGSIDITVSGGTSPYTYAWSNGATTQDLSGLAAGSYSVTVKDATAKQISKTITVNQPNVLTANTLIVNENCYGGTTGSVGLVASGGSGGYTYLWSTGATTKSISGLAKGTYNYTITDAKGCTTSGSATVTEPTAIVASGTVTDLKCNNDGSGKIDVSVSGGTSPYSYTWSNGATTQDVSNLSMGGTYGVSINDAKNCKSTLFFTVSEPSPLVLSGTSIDYSCTVSGKVNLNVNGGTSPYSYAWSNGSTTEDLDGLLNGNYSVTVKDANKCSSSLTFAVDSVDPFVVNGQLENPTCETCKDGLIIPIPTGGLYDYTWVWTDGITGKIRAGLGVGTYTVRMTDSNGCWMDKTYVLVASSAKTSAVIDGNIVEKTILIYPNPANEFVNIQLSSFENEKVDIQLINSMGQVVYTNGASIETNNWETKIELNAFSNGIYFLYITNSSNEPLKYQFIISGR